MIHHASAIKKGRKNIVTSSANTQKASKAATILSLLSSIVINAALPVVIYWALKTYTSSSDFVALVASGVPSLIDSIVGVIRRKRIDLLAGIVLFGIITSLVTMALVVTNVPASMLSFEQVFALLRARWQIELLFKLWKEHALIDEWTEAKPFRVLCEVYAKLLAVVLQHWFVLLSAWDDPHRSLPGVCEVLREQVPVLVHGLMKRIPLRQAVRLVIENVSPACSIPARSNRPSTSRLLLGALEPSLT